jgi:DNA-binding NarL/FixJ family response regulator
MRVFVVDDEPLIREGLRHTLNAQPEIEVVGEAASAREGFAGIEKTRPDVVVMDLSMPGLDGAAAARDLRVRVPGAKVLVLTIHNRLRDALEALAAGACGFALKTEPLSALLSAIRRVAAGHGYVTPSLAPMVSLRQAEPSGAPGDVLATLSVREREVFHMVAAGVPSKEIAQELCISRKTVETHISRIHRKLGCKRLADIVRFAAVHGLLRQVPPDPDAAQPR